VVYSADYDSEPQEILTQYAQFTLFGWAKNNYGTYLNGDFRMKALVSYFRVEGQDPEIREFIYDFSKDVQSWQYGSLTFAIDTEEVALTEIKIVLEYTGVCGSVIFDDIVLLKDSNSSVIYDYYTSGLLSKAQNGEHGMNYKYTDGNTGDIELAIDSYGTVTGYIYDTKRRLVVEITYNHTGNYYENYLQVTGKTQKQDVIIDPERYGEQHNLYVTGYTTYDYNDYGFCIETRSYSVKEIVTGIAVGDSKIYYKQSSSEPPEPVVYSATTLKATAEYLSLATEYNTDAGSFMFGAVTSETDTRGKITTYFYDNSTGYLSATISPEGYGTAYTYDTLGNIEYVLPAEIATNGYTSEITGDIQYVYDDANRLEKIKTDTTEYAFSYDNFGNTTGITASGSTLATYVYNSYNGKLNEIDYGNGFKVKYVYDSLDRIKEIQYNTNGGSTFSTAYRYEYGALGEVIGIYDVVNNKSILNEYDPQGRVIKTVYASGDVTVSGKRVSYDDQSRVAGVRFNFDDVRTGAAADSYVDIGSYYSYNDKGELSSATVKHNDLSAEITPNYDNLGRTSSKATAIEYNSSALGTLTNNYVFYNGSYLVSDAITKVAIGSSTTATELTNRKYYYDNNGNITEITNATGQIQNKYHYDEKGQIEREDNLVLNASYEWEYDDAGNITEKKTYAFTTGDLGTPISTINYTYEANTDRLTSYNGYGIIYDEIGNPTTYKGMSLGWKNGRELYHYGNYIYSYDANGIRTKIQYSSNITEFIVDGSTVLRQSWNDWSNGNYVADYIYSEAGIPLAFALSTNGGDYVYYFYETNIQGDVIAVYDSSWNKIVSFSYDAWGNFTPTINNSTVYTSNFQKAILFRYRGYIYDTETQLYYLQSRYYDPAVGRFINADDISYLGADGTLLSYNLYAYCKNNPINDIDPNGKIALTSLIGAAIGGAIAGSITGVVSHIVSCGVNGDDITVSGVLGALGSGALTGAIGATVGVIGGAAAIIGSIAVGTISGTITAINTEGSIENKIDAGLMAGVVSSVGTYLGTKLPIFTDTAITSGITAFVGGLFMGTQTEIVNVATQEFVAYIHSIPQSVYQKYRAVHTVL